VNRPSTIVGDVGVFAISVSRQAKQQKRLRWR
jgi:hypothetical protein